VLLADSTGTVVGRNAAASRLLPGAEPGLRLDEAGLEWLTGVHESLVGTGVDAAPGAESEAVTGRVGERSFEARATRTEDGDLVWWFTDRTGQRAAEDALHEERERTAFLAEASNALLATLNVDRCMEVTAQLAAKYLADAAVVIGPALGRRLPVTYGSGDGAVRALIAADPAAVPGLEEALQGFPPVASKWIDPGGLPGWVVPPGFAGRTGSVVITPLPGHGIPAGALMLLRRSDHSAFTEPEEVFAQLFAARAGAALSAARMYAHQASITSTLMQELLPPRLEQVHGVEFAGGYRPSGQRERIGGDFYDVHPGGGPGQESLAVLGDVCGKGLDAAVLTGKIRNTLQALLPMADDHQRMLTLLNGALLTTDHTRFATLVLASVLRRESSVRLRLTSAGHPAPLIVRSDGSVEEAATQGTLVGALPECHADTVTAELAPGEMCLLYTDGIIEARGGPLGDTMFGEERLAAALSDCAGMPAEAVIERIQMLAGQWIGQGRHDDMALVAITAPRHAHLSAVDGHTRGRYTA
jgi:serine phosphatase RsbU (regulator of sigma subunit)